MYDERGCEKMELNQFHFYSSFISVGMGSVDACGGGF